MTTSRKETHGPRAYAALILWVVFLVGSYWLLTEWPDLPRLIGSVKAGLHLPV